MDYLISQELAQAVLDYLAAHPYREVADMVDKLRNIPKAPEPVDLTAEPSTV